MGMSVPGRRGACIRSHLQLREDFPAITSRDHPDVARSKPPDHGAMSYAIIWIDDGGMRLSGRLDLTPTAVILTGTGAGAIRELGYTEVISARVERCAQVELPPEPALVLEMHDGERRRHRIARGSRSVARARRRPGSGACGRPHTRRVAPPATGVAGRVHAGTPANAEMTIAERVEIDDRLRSLIAAGMALTSESSLDALLARLVEIAADLTGARYAALGVIDATGSQLERFVTHGIDPADEEAIGAPPRGRGILGVLIHEGRPLRLPDLTLDRRSVGFPAGHPPMRSFLGVPILLRGVAYGNLYLTEKAGGAEFSEQDEELVTLLAGQAAVAIENVRLYEAATRWSERLESLNEIGNALATETELDTLLELVARRLRELLEARLVTVLLPNGPDELRFAAAAGEGGEGLLGRDSAPARIEERQGAGRGAERTGRLRARRSGGRPDHDAPPRRSRRPLGSPARGRPTDRRARRARQARRFRTGGSTTRTSGSPRRLRAEPQSPSTSPSGSRGMPSGESSAPRSSSAAGLHGSFMTRPARR